MATWHLSSATYWHRGVHKYHNLWILQRGESKIKMILMNRGPAARARRNQRAAASQAALSALAEVDPPPPRPLCHLLSPSPTTRRRRVMSVGRPEMPTFSSLNLDGSSSPSPAPPPPPQPSAWICYDDCENDIYCSNCGKCIVLWKEHEGCDWDDEDGLKIDFHCAVCC